MVDKIEKSKKRKKNADGSSRPSKRVAIEDERNVQISLKDGDEWAPVIGMSFMIWGRDLLWFKRSVCTQLWQKC